MWRIARSKNGFDILVDDCVYEAGFKSYNEALRRLRELANGEAKPEHELCGAIKIG